MLAFLKNTLAQINSETRQGSAAVARVTTCAGPAGPGVPDKGKTARQPVDAVTSGTQPITRYFAMQATPRAKDP